jgi:hypothetical protein
MELNMVECLVDLYEGYNIGSFPHVLGSPISLGTINHRTSLVGSKPLEEETIETLSKVAKQKL